MRLVIQRVKRAEVLVKDTVFSKIEKGLLILLGLSKEDRFLKDKNINKIVQKVLNLRIFADKENKLNLSLLDIGGEILLVSQFTLYANCRKGRRPNFSLAMPGEEAKKMFAKIKNIFSSSYKKVYTGAFGEEMEIKLINDGPVTIILDSQDIL
ncbi:D-aminoacyl-tRNA deacylase [Desulfonauticus submarinus]